MAFKGHLYLVVTLIPSLVHALVLLSWLYLLFSTYFWFSFTFSIIFNWFFYTHRQFFYDLRKYHNGCVIPHSDVSTLTLTERKLISHPCVQDWYIVIWGMDFCLPLQIVMPSNDAYIFLQNFSLSKVKDIYFQKSALVHLLPYIIIKRMEGKWTKALFRSYF